MTSSGDFDHQLSAASGLPHHLGRSEVRSSRCCRKDELVALEIIPKQVDSSNADSYISTHARHSGHRQIVTTTRSSEFAVVTTGLTKELGSQGRRQSRPRNPEGHGLRIRGPEWRRQDDDHTDAARPDPSDQW